MTHFSSSPKALRDSRIYARWLLVIQLLTILGIGSIAIISQIKVLRSAEVRTNYHLRSAHVARLAEENIEAIAEQLNGLESDDDVAVSFNAMLNDRSFNLAWTDLDRRIGILKEAQRNFADPEYEQPSNRVFEGYQTLSTTLETATDLKEEVSGIALQVETLELRLGQLALSHESGNGEHMRSIPAIQRSRMLQIVLAVALMLSLSLLLLYFIVSKWRKDVESTISGKRLLDDMGALAKVGGWEFDILHNKPSFTDEVYRIYDIPIARQPSIEKGISFYHPDDQPTIRKAFDELINLRKSYDLELRIISGKGITKWVRTTGSAIVEKGNVTKVLGSIQDITKYKDSETKSRLLGRTVDESSSCVLISDVAGQTTYANKAFERRNGISKEDMVAKSCHFQEWLDLDQEMLLEMKSHIREGKSWSGVNVRTSSDGKRAVEDVSVYPMLDELGTPTHYVAIVLDLTDRADLEEQRTRSSKMESVGLLAGGIAHDFNNMLGVILGNADLALVQSDQDAEVAPFIREIKSTAMRSAQLTKQLLGFARKQPMKPSRLDLNKEIESLHDMFLRLLGEQVKLSCKPTEYPLVIYADSSQIVQILVNLVVNARDAMDGQGHIRIETGITEVKDHRVSHGEDIQPGKYAYVSVSDDGYGIAPEVIDKIYEPFFTTKGNGVSTGLGLSTVFGIVRQNNGFIEVESQLDQGATFYVCLPLVEEEIEASKVHSGVELTHASAPKSILLVEDEASLLELTTKLLKTLGHDVVSVATPHEALRETGPGQRSFDLLLTDVIMPDLNGMELAERILKQHPEMKCLFVSGYPQDVIGKLPSEKGNHFFLAKPYTMKELREKLKDIFTG